MLDSLVYCNGYKMINMSEYNNGNYKNTTKHKMEMNVGDGIEFL